MKGRGCWPFVVLLVAGCASVRRAPPPGIPAECRDVQYRGLFASTDRGGRVQRFRMSARICGGDEALLEFRGLVGGTALIAGVRVGKEVRLVFPSRRLVVDGPDEGRFWRKWTDASLDGSFVRALVDGPQAGSAVIGGWTVETSDRRSDERFPGTLRAVDEAGNRLELEKTTERPAAGVLRFPPVPAGGTWEVTRDQEPGAASSPGTPHE